MKIQFWPTTEILMTCLIVGFKHRHLPLDWQKQMQIHCQLLEPREWGNSSFFMPHQRDEFFHLSEFPHKCFELICWNRHQCVLVSSWKPFYDVPLISHHCMALCLAITDWFLFHLCVTDASVFWAYFPLVVQDSWISWRTNHNHHCSLNLELAARKPQLSSCLHPQAVLATHPCLTLSAGAESFNPSQKLPCAVLLRAVPSLQLPCFFLASSIIFKGNSVVKSPCLTAQRAPH